MEEEWRRGGGEVEWALGGCGRGTASQFRAFAPALSAGRSSCFEWCSSSPSA